MKTIVVNILTLVILIAFVESAVAEEGVNQQKLTARFVEVFTKSEKSRIDFDFKVELELAEELGGILKQIEKPRPMSLFDLNLNIDDLKKKALFNETQLIHAIKHFNLVNDAVFQARGNNHERAIFSYLKSLEISNFLYGITSFYSLGIKVNLANQYALTKRFQEGLTHVIEVQKVLHENRFNSELYRSAIRVEMNLYDFNGEHEKSINRGIELVSLLEESGRQKTDEYHNIQGSVAAQLNLLKRHQQARVHAGKGLNTKLPITQSNVIPYTRLLLQYGRANVGLEDYKKANRAFAELLRMTAAIPNYSLSDEVKYMEEFVPVLRKLGRNQEAEQMEEKIKRMRFDLPLQKSRFSD